MNYKLLCLLAAIAIIFIISVTIYSQSADAHRETNNLTFSLYGTSFDIGDNVAFSSTKNPNHHDRPVLTIYDPDGKAVYHTPLDYGHAINQSSYSVDANYLYRTVQLGYDWSGPGLYTMVIQQDIHMVFSYFWYNTPTAEQYPIHNNSGPLNIIPSIPTEPTNPCNS